MSVAGTENTAAIRGLDSAMAELAQTFVHWLETAIRPERLFSPAVFGDVSTPQWRIQTRGPEGLFAVREAGHLSAGTVRVEGLDLTARGFLLQFDERWSAEGQRWYARELVHAVVDGGVISELIVYCTGDWDEATQRRHAAEVVLLRP